MPTLALDTAFQAGGVALAQGDRLLGELLQNSAATHSRRVLAAVDFLLGQLGQTRGAIDGLAVTVGPGYFTGLRIGLATAQGLALGLGAPLVGVSTLRLLAQNLAVGAGGLIWALADARRGLLYAACFRDEPGGLTRLEDDMAISPQRLLPLLRPPAVLVGGGARLLAEAHLAEGLRLAPRWADLPRPGLLALLGAERLAAGLGRPPEAVRARYCRPSDAEVRFQLPLDEYRLIE